jgi:hypothetical protein
VRDGTDRDPFQATAGWTGPDLPPERLDELLAQVKAELSFKSEPADEVRFPHSSWP